MRSFMGDTSSFQMYKDFKFLPRSRALRRARVERIAQRRSYRNAVRRALGGAALLRLAGEQNLAARLRRGERSDARKALLAQSKRFERQEALYIHAAEDMPRPAGARDRRSPVPPKRAAAREHGTEKLDEDRKPRPLCAAGGEEACRRRARRRRRSWARRARPAPGLGIGVPFSAA